MVKSRYIGDGHPTFNRNPYTIGLMTIPYYMEIMAVKTLAHIRNVEQDLLNKPLKHFTCYIGFVPFGVFG